MGTANHSDTNRSTATAGGAANATTPTAPTAAAVTPTAANANAAANESSSDKWATTMRQFSRPRRMVVVCSGLAVVLATVMVLCYAEPFLDGDLFWQMAYARQIIDHGTLRLDHSVFSWTPASNHIIYCAWAAELILYGLWNHAGVGSLFALRYAVIFVVIWLMWDYARRLKLADKAWTYLILLVAAITIGAGTLIKPELFSLLFMNAAVWVFFRGRLRAGEGLSPEKWFYLVPIIVMVWVNFHGGFSLFAPFLLATAAGEGLILGFSEVKVLTARAYGHLLAAWGLCGVAVLVNPYGVRYPVQLFQDFVLGKTARPDMGWNIAMRSIFIEAGAGLDFLKLGLMMAGLLAVVFVLRTQAAPHKRMALDFTFLLVNLAYVPLFILYIRSTWYWAPVFAYSFFFAAAQADKWQRENDRLAWHRFLIFGKILPVAVVLMFASISTAAVWQAWRQPASRSWMGFGNSYRNPVPEAEFLAASKLGPRLINLFDSGGYLLWRLWPRYLVMTDQRSFPYLSWFNEQYQFSAGANFEGFLAAHPADTAVIDLSERRVWQKFLRSPDWKLVYYGPTAAVFVRVTVPPDRLAAGIAPKRFEHVKNAEVAFRAFCFASGVGDYRTAWSLEEQLQTDLRYQATAEELWVAREYRAAQRALQARDYARALELFHATLPGMGFSDRDWQIQIYLVDIARLQRLGYGQATGPDEAALAKLAGSS